jgi:hypothetical protein
MGTLNGAPDDVAPRAHAGALAHVCAGLDGGGGEVAYLRHRHWFEARRDRDLYGLPLGHLERLLDDRAETAADLCDVMLLPTRTRWNRWLPRACVMEESSRAAV